VADLMRADHSTANRTHARRRASGGSSEQGPHADHRTVDEVTLHVRSMGALSARPFRDADTEQKIPPLTRREQIIRLGTGSLKDGFTVHPRATFACLDSGSTPQRLGQVAHACQCTRWQAERRWPSDCTGSILSHF